MKSQDKRFKHGQCGTKLHNKWRKIKERCYSKNSISYKYYGEIGIELSNIFLDFITFKNYVMLLPNAMTDGYSIDRVENSGNYEPMNLRWASKSTQAQNTRVLRSNNTSGYRGVSSRKNGTKFIVRISVDNEIKYLGYFSDIVEAAKTYDKYVTDNNLDHIKNFK